MNYTFNNSSIVSVNSGTIVLNVSGKTRTFVDAKLISAVDGKIVLDLPNVLLTNGAYITIHLQWGNTQRTFISKTSDNSWVTYHVTQYAGGIKSAGNWGGDCILRNATPEEIKELNDQLTAEGKRWNPDTMQIEKLKWKPLYNDTYYCIIISSYVTIITHIWKGDYLDRDYYKSNNCFKTVEEAEAKLAKIKDLLLEV